MADDGIDGLCRVLYGRAPKPRDGSQATVLFEAAERIATLTADRDALRAVVEALPRCHWWRYDAPCAQPGTWVSDDGLAWCDEHHDARATDEEYPYAAPLRAYLASRKGDDDG